MRPIWMFLAVLFVDASRALAGITVSSYTTTAGLNSYTPVAGMEYTDIQTLTNVTPADLNVSVDWMGPNASGGPNTWHFVGAAQIATTTAFDADSLAVTAAGSFAYDITTTVDFIDPSSSAIFSPGGGANYEGRFTIDVPASYAMTATLNQWGRVRLNSLGTGLLLFDLTNPSPTPTTVDFIGTIPAGQYRVLIASGLGAPNFPNGVNHFGARGGYEDVIFMVQVPEPGTFAGASLYFIQTLCRGRRCAC